MVDRAEARPRGGAGRAGPRDAADPAGGSGCPVPDVTRLYLVRYGESVWSAQHRWQGAADPPLSEAGAQQARHLAGRLRAARVAAVYTSPLRRAAQTARIVAAACGLAPRVVDGLREVGFGEWEGLTAEEVERRYASLLPRRQARPDLIRIPGGEPLEQARQRVMEAVAGIARAHPGAAVAVVAHGGVNRLVLLTLLGAPLASYSRFQQAPGCVNVVDIAERSGRILAINDTDHLEPPPAVRPAAPL